MSKLSPRVTSLIAAIFVIAGSLYVGRFLLPVLKNSWKACGQPVELTAAELQADPNPKCWSVVVSKVEQQRFHEEIDLDAFYEDTRLLPIGATGTVVSPNETTLLLRVDRSESIDDLKRELQNETVAAVLNDSCHADYAEKIENHLGELDWDRVRFVRVQEDSPRKLFVMFAIGLVIVFVGLVSSCHLVYAQFTQQSVWEQRLEEPRDYRKHADAMNLCGAESYGGHRSRDTKRDYKVPEVEVPLPRWVVTTKRVVGSLLGGIVFTAGQIAFQSCNNPTGLAFIGSVAALVVCMIGFFVCFRTRKDVPPVSVVLDEPVAAMNEGVFKLQHAILGDLGFRHLGHIKTLHQNTVLYRAIYSSADGNVAVETGMQNGRPYTCINSLLSNGALIETHSMVTERTEFDKLETHSCVRQAGKGMDLLELLGVHEKRLAQAIRSTNTMEVEWNDENYLPILNFVQVVCQRAS